MEYKIKTASACYTGGGIYIYWGQLEDGLHFRAADGYDVIYICNADTSTEEADYQEFYDAHTVKELYGPEFVAFWNEMLTRIINSDVRENWCPEELTARLVKSIEPPTFDELTARISEALESELSRIYDELEIESGDITPTQSLEWDEATAKIAYLFKDLIAQNK